MNKKKQNDLTNDLELGKYLEKDLIALTDDDVSAGGKGITVTIDVTKWVSKHTCPTGVCTRAC